MKKTTLLITSLLLMAVSCHRNTETISDWDAYITEHEEWQHSRLERLKAEKGWLNLAGLFWLEEGENTFGSDISNSIVFPANFPAYGGSIILTDTVLSLSANPDTEIYIDSIAVKDVILGHDQSKETSIMELGSFRWFIIKRGDRYGIRLRDLEHPRIAQLDHIPSYPFNKELVVEAELVEFDSLKTVEVPTVIEGFSEYYKVPGELRFRIDGKKQGLLPFKSGNGYFLIVGDATNGIDTYGAGRFLYCSQVEGNKVIIDFNKAYNPPCAFSPYATCPLPPIENILDVEIKAGERAVHME